MILHSSSLCSVVIAIATLLFLSTVFSGCHRAQQKGALIAMGSTYSINADERALIENEVENWLETRGFESTVSPDDEIEFNGVDATTWAGIQGEGENTSWYRLTGEHLFIRVRDECMDVTNRPSDFHSYHFFLHWHVEGNLEAVSRVELESKRIREDFEGFKDALDSRIRDSRAESESSGSRHAATPSE